MVVEKTDGLRCLMYIKSKYPDPNKQHVYFVGIPVNSYFVIGHKLTNQQTNSPSFFYYTFILDYAQI